MLEKQDIDRLVFRLKDGDSLAVSDLYDHYSDSLYGIASRIVRSEEVAQDVLQDAMVKIWKNIHAFNPEKATFFTWMLNITRNTAIDFLRKSKKERPGSIQDVESDVYKSEGTVQNVNIIGLDALVKNLSAEQQLIVDYIYFRGYTQQEVSDELEIPLGTVKTRVRSAVQELRKYFSVLLFWI